MKSLSAWHLAPAVVGMVVLLGCQQPDIPMPTSGPNQVVIKVPGMT
jgi:hypothetical protein